MDYTVCFFFSSRRRHTRCLSDWSSDVCSSDLEHIRGEGAEAAALTYGFTMVVTAVMFNLTWFYRSEERRVGKECRSRWARQHSKNKHKKTRRRITHRT